MPRLEGGTWAGLTQARRAQPRRRPYHGARSPSPPPPRSRPSCAPRARPGIRTRRPPAGHRLRTVSPRSPARPGGLRSSISTQRTPVLGPHSLSHRLPAPCGDGPPTGSSRRHSHRCVAGGRPSPWQSPAFGRAGPTGRPARLDDGGNLAQPRHDTRHAAAALAGGTGAVHTYDVDDWKAFAAHGIRIVGPPTIVASRTPFPIR